MTKDSRIVRSEPGEFNVEVILTAVRESSKVDSNRNRVIITLYTQTQTDLRLRRISI